MSELSCPECGDGVLVHIDGGEPDRETGYADGDYYKCRSCGERFYPEDLESEGRE